MKKRNLKPTQTAPVERPQAGSTSRDPLAMFAAGGVGASGRAERRCASNYEICRTSGERAQVCRANFWQCLLDDIRSNDDLFRDEYAGDWKKWGESLVDTLMDS